MSREFQHEPVAVGVALDREQYDVLVGGGHAHKKLRGVQLAFKREEIIRVDGPDGEVTSAKVEIVEVLSDDPEGYRWQIQLVPVEKEPYIIPVTEPQWNELLEGQLTLDAPVGLERNDLVILRLPDGKLEPVQIDDIVSPPHRKPQGVVLRRRF